MSGYKFHPVDHLYNRVKSNIHVLFFGLPVGYCRPYGGYAIVNRRGEVYLSILPHLLKKAVNKICI